MAGVHDGVVDDVGDVVVGEGVGDLPAPALGPNHVAGPQHPEVLGDEGLRHAQRVDQLMDAAGATVEVTDDGQAVGAGERPQQVGGAVERATDDGRRRRR